MVLEYIKLNLMTRGKLRYSKFYLNKPSGLLKIGWEGAPKLKMSKYRLEVNQI